MASPSKCEIDVDVSVHPWGAGRRYEAVLRLKTPETRLVDLRGQTVIPGLNDSHLHIIRGGLHYNLELRWDGVPSLADALRMLREQASTKPAQKPLHGDND
jgi:predicted amidohydrolase YtcJ